MYNNYSTTNNHYQMNGLQFQTHLMPFDKPRFACIFGSIYDVHAMVIAHTARFDEKRQRTVIETFRIPLCGPEMMDIGPYNGDVADDSFFFLRGRDYINATEFRKFIRQVRSECSVIDGINDLKRNKLGFYYFMEEFPIKVCRDGNIVLLDCEWFNLTLECQDDKTIWPTDITEICAIADLLRTPLCSTKIRFLPDDKESAFAPLAAELQRLVDIFYKDNLYYSGKIAYDGEFCYSEDFGRMPMSRDEFFRKFPDANPVWYKRKS